MTQTLKEKTKSALIWNLFDKFGQQLLYFLVGIILARILSVEDFGMIGILGIFMALSTVLSDSGFSYALIKKQAATQDDYNAVFYFNITISIAIYAILFFVAPYIASFYNQPQLADLSRVLFLSVVFNAAGSIQSSNLIKHMRFSAWAKINIAALLVSSAITLVCVFSGLGVWTLVIQRVGGEFFRTLFLWGSKNWFPTLSFRPRVLKDFFAFSSHLLVFRIINESFNNLYSLTIGKVFSPIQVGYYTQADKYQNMAITTIGSVYRNIVMPVIAQVGDDFDRVKRVFRKMVKNIVFITFPIAVLLAIVAKPVIVILIGDKWLTSVPILQILCIAGAFNSIVTIFFEMFAAIGRSNLFLKMELFRKPFLLTGIVLFIGEGIVALAWVWLAYTVFTLMVSLFYSNKAIKYSIVELFTDVVPSILLSVVIAIPVYYLSYVITNMYWLISCQSVLFLSLYVLFSHLFKLDEFYEFKTFFISTKNKFNFPL